ncbi:MULTISPECIES: hypothetical protein [unclassified Streptomyces]|uniref:hypothetical protein n=1 Tax=unclassified Streptomyces TaxID=2593676 RepID=UPI000DC7AC88|nr:MULTISPECIES: hypothetical protein [unclassified Streptomyces]AWZ09662.1 hypothetical protein DRB89_40435 [Streptomyces sp. ICC4]AWZ17411.1 hypothetical protein DRB96_40825 [Streptomyces sp. ICC1]
MLRYYGKDLLDWHRGELSSRRLQVLLKHLPRDSSLNRELFGEAADWSVTDHLLAAAVDHLAAANWMFASVNTAEDDDPPDPPEPVPRPDGKPFEGSADGDGPDPQTAEPAPAPETLQRFFG